MRANGRTRGCLPPLLQQPGSGATFPAPTWTGLPAHGSGVPSEPPEVWAPLSVRRLAGTPPLLCHSGYGLRGRSPPHGRRV